MTSRRWEVLVGVPAEGDLAGIIDHTIEAFGERQATIYEETILAAIEALGGGPEIMGARARDDISPGLRTLHVARHGRHGRHFVMFRVELPQRIRILRIL